jgi:hypothetical protein
MKSAKATGALLIAIAAMGAALTSPAYRGGWEHRGWR